MAVTKSGLDQGEDYASAADLLAADDLPQHTLTVWGWKKNGAALKVRVRGLTLVEREAVRAAAWLPTGLRDIAVLYAGYLRHGMVVPSLNDEQARQLTEKHAATVEQIADYISALTELDYDAITAAANDLAQPDDAERPEAQAPRRARKAA